MPHGSHVEAEALEGGLELPGGDPHASRGVHAGQVEHVVLIDRDAERLEVAGRGGLPTEVGLLRHMGDALDDDALGPWLEGGRDWRRVGGFSFAAGAEGDASQDQNERSVSTHPRLDVGAASIFAIGGLGGGGRLESGRPRQNHSSSSSGSSTAPVA